MLAPLTLLGLTLVTAQGATPEAPAVRTETTATEAPQAGTPKAEMAGAQSKMDSRRGRPKILGKSNKLSKIRLPVRRTAAPASQPPVPLVPTTGALPQPSANSAPVVAAPAGPVGELVIPAEQASHAFGDLREGTIARTTVRLENTGEGDLVLAALRATCGCTKAEVFLFGENGELVPYEMNTPIAPGTPFQVNVGVDSTRKRGNWTGSVSIFSNDTTQPDVIKLQANVQQMFETSPAAYMQFGEVRVGTEKEVELVVSSSLVDAFGLRVDEKVFEHTPWLEVDLTPINPDASGRANMWTVTGRLTSATPEQQRWNGPINLITDVPLGEQLDAEGQPMMHEVLVTAVAQIQGLVTANPFYISMGIVPPGERREKSFTLEIHDPEFQPEALEVVVEGRTANEVELWKEHTSATAERLPDGNFLVKMVMEGLPDSMSGPFGGTVKVKVGHPTKEFVTVPFSGVCRNSVTAPQARPPVPPPANTDR